MDPHTLSELVACQEMALIECGVLPEAAAAAIALAVQSAAGYDDAIDAVSAVSPADCTRALDVYQPSLARAKRALSLAAAHVALR